MKILKSSVEFSPGDFVDNFPYEKLMEMAYTAMKHPTLSVDVEPGNVSPFKVLTHLRTNFFEGLFYYTFVVQMRINDAPADLYFSFLNPKCDPLDLSETNDVLEKFYWQNGLPQNCEN
jgi:hypothetical protein